MFMDIDTDIDGVCTLTEVVAYLDRNPDVADAVKKATQAKRKRGSTTLRARPKPDLAFVDVGACSVAKRCGASNEDAYFMSPASGTIGVADGVGGWSAFGVDSSLYSSTLVHKAAEALDDGSRMSPRQVMELAHQRTRIVGSAAMLVAAVRGTHLDVANVGDCRCRVFRRGRFVLATDEMVKGPKKPYQLAVQGGDAPGDAETCAFPLRSGDLVMVASDGVDNNLSDAVLVEMLDDGVEIGSVGPPQGPRRSALEIAETVVLRAQEVSQEEGGVRDDITAVVAYVGRA